MHQDLFNDCFRYKEHSVHAQRGIWVDLEPVAVVADEYHARDGIEPVAVLSTDCFSAHVLSKNW